ncbi:hypothetical protein B0A52_09870 [Exophiala mesophila]|uniref:Structural maintenance of chromosomes protein 5 n=1 Tax=Exophiala mesophila TaxID=212818 RepID=A0A438MSB9_EXOME|nr:hypothetical protein B0A52_09870 [Exophiala mesophila]
MDSSTARRSRARDSDDDESRPSTPLSTAPNDSKRLRRQPNSRSNDDGDDVDEESLTALRVPPATQDPLPQDATQIAMVARGEPSKSVHQPGAIVRIKMINFVTYTSAECRPGPNLNMVIGPNGTGKSTLICAICLGLGWPPSILGRAKEAHEFIKHGCHEATIEIEIQRKSGKRNPVIVRQIKREGNKSVYTLNNSPSTGKAIQALAHSFNIQVDNLCQFLPQDKVAEFAAMNPVELLASTQRAVATSDMTKMHEQLKLLRKNHVELLTSVESQNEQLTHLRTRQENQRTDVERMRERAQIQQRLKWFEMCRPVAKFADTKRRYTAAKEKKDSLKKELNQLRAVSAPTLKRKEAKEAYARQTASVRDARAEAVKEENRKCDILAKEIETCQDKIKDAANAIKNERAGIPTIKSELMNSQRKIRDLELKYSESQEGDFDTQNLSDLITKARAEQRQAKQHQADLQPRLEQLAAQDAERNTALSQLKSSLQRLETQAGQQESKLQTLSRDTFQAWKWIQENQDLFTQTVYGPPIVECSLKDPKMADAVEAFLQQGDFKVITVQNQTDFRLLQQKLFKEKKLHDVSLRTCSNSNLDQIKAPFSIEEMHRYGLDSWVIDHIQGPATVLVMLCQDKRLDKCAISSRELSQQQHDAVANTGLQGYVAGGKSYQFIRRAEYGSAGHTSRVRDVRPAQIWTNQPIDAGRKANLQRAISEKNGEKEIIQEEIQSLKKEYAEWKRVIDRTATTAKEASEEKDKIQMSQRAWLVLPTQISHAKAAAEASQAKLDGFREQESKLIEGRDAAIIRKTEAVLEFAAATRDLRKAFSSLMEAEVMMIEATSDAEGLTAQNEHIIRSIEDKQNEFEEAVQAFNEGYTAAQAVQRLCLSLKAEAERLEAEEDEPGLAQVVARVGEQIRTEADLETEIDSIKAELELTEGGSTNIIKDFEERARSIERLERQLQEADKQSQDYKHSIKEIRDRWEPRLDGYVEQISESFFASFHRIGLKGQVAVHKASSDRAVDCTEENGGSENGLDFENWAIHISVSFRASENMTLLDSHRQSGGERAVSTIFYLMALQSLNRAPFRVVDEINQGMDPRNERMVHGRLVDIAADNGSQYFLVTPKLLSGLKYRPGMTVLCIVSGENMPAARERDENGKWRDGRKVDFREFVKKAKQLGLGDHVVHSRVDSGLDLHGSQRAQIDAY